MIDKISMLYWYPKIKDLGIPMPETEIVEVDLEYDKHLNPTNLDKHMQEIYKKAEKLGFPLFLRTDHLSGKHAWKKTCFVGRREDLRQHLLNLVEEGFLADVIGVPCKAFVLRKFVEMDSRFVAFYGEMPVNPERRYFIKDGKILCHHPYWIEEAIEEGRSKCWDKLPKDWKEILKEINAEKGEEIKLLSFYANKVIPPFGGEYWSIDFCKARDGTWYLIDMACGERSWHDEKCPNSKLSPIINLI